MQYVNTKTRAVIDTACVIKGGNWVPVEENQPKESAGEPELKKSAPKKIPAKKKSGE